MNFRTAPIWSCIGVITLLAACGGPDPCEGFPNELSEEPVRIWDLPKVEPLFVPVAAMNFIDRCYPNAEYSYGARKLIEEEARRFGTSKFILSYEQEGVSDARTAFVVESDGSISLAFQYGM